MSTENLTQQQAIDKIKELVKAAEIGMFTSGLSTLPLNSRPMATMDVDDDGNLWYFSKYDSTKNEDIKSDNRVQVFYANKSSSEYLSVYGTAEISTNKQKIKELWTPMVKAWFTEGEDDPSITVIKVVPVDVYYWDTKTNKLVSLVKIAASVVTGKTMDDGVEGKLIM